MNRLPTEFFHFFSVITTAAIQFSCTVGWGELWIIDHVLKDKSKSYYAIRSPILNFSTEYRDARHKGCLAYNQAVSHEDFLDFVTEDLV